MHCNGLVFLCRRGAHPIDLRAYKIMCYDAFIIFDCVWRRAMRLAGLVLIFANLVSTAAAAIEISEMENNMKGNVCLWVPRT